MMSYELYFASLGMKDSSSSELSQPIIKLEEPFEKFDTKISTKMALVSTDPVLFWDNFGPELNAR